ncbi:LacI family DNA-binding transcriptional regulator [Microbacterium excoecariae]|uniref:LacI family DNA-binding transcriptional regulator n=1 Tax=Microbacterium excoecariae TaxID=2715210 RepID=UPI00140DD9BA|nr:LacI family DNA-binding transcriptional regulator [Microbacterium excoecariae]NHI16704.1 LacI family transcriptional regulator [Microbacterium excoecariae]
MARTNRPSMADVAERAGVSHQTVSRVLNDHAYVREETRARVLDAIGELGYRRNQAARTLVTTRTATIGVVTTSTAHSGPAQTVLAIEAAARDRGYFVSLASVGSRDPREVFDQLLNQGVDGIVVVAPLAEVAAVVDRHPLAVPCVVVAARGEGAALDVAVDQRRAARDLTRHLLAEGHTRIAHLEGPRGWFDAIERSGGFAEAMAEGGAEPRIVPAGGWAAADGYRAAALLAEEIAAGEVTAILAANDLLAIGALRACSERGIEAPRDVAVAGFDDIDGAAFLRPSLTTVAQPFADLGAAAVDTLVAAGQGAPPAGAVRIRARLVVRESTTRVG